MKEGWIESLEWRSISKSIRGPHRVRLGKAIQWMGGTLL